MPFLFLSNSGGGLRGLTDDLGDLVDDGGTDGLGNGVAGLDGGDNLLRYGNIDAVLGDDLVASGLDHSGGGRSVGHGGVEAVAVSVRGSSSQELRISFGLSLAFLQDNSSGGALLVNDFFALFLVGDFLADNILGGTDVLHGGSAGLHFLVFVFGTADGDNGGNVGQGSVVAEAVAEAMGQKLGIGFGFGGSRNCADQAQNGNLEKK